MVFEVQIAVEGPREVGDTAQEFGGVLSKGRADIVADNELLVDIADVVGSGAFGRFEYLQPGDMHRVLARFAEQEHRIERRYQLHPMTFAFPRTSPCPLHGTQANSSGESMPRAMPIASG